MKIKLHNSLLIALALALPVSCDKEEVCDALEICDLVTTVGLSVPSVQIGAISSILNVVGNIAATALECEDGGTEDAPPSMSEVAIEYRAGSGDAWEPIVVNTSGQDAEAVAIPYGAIVAGTEINREVDYAINEAGQYRWRTNADFPQEVMERDETNNDDDLTAGLVISNNRAYSEILTVTAPAGYVRPEGVPQVEILGIR